MCVSVCVSERRGGEIVGHKLKESSSKNQDIILTMGYTTTIILPHIHCVPVIHTNVGNISLSAQQQRRSASVSAPAEMSYISGCFLLLQCDSLNLKTNAKASKQTQTPSLSLSSEETGVLRQSVFNDL